MYNIYYTRDGSIDILQAHAATTIIYIIIMTFCTQSYTYNTPLYNKTLYAHHHRHTYIVSTARLVGGPRCRRQRGLPQLYTYIYRPQPCDRIIILYR